MGYPGESLRIPPLTQGKKLTRREMLARAGEAGLACCFLGFTSPSFSCGGSKSDGSNSSSKRDEPKSDEPKSSRSSSAPVSDDQFLDNLERAAFLFFWEQASAATGQVKDRALAGGNDSRTIASIAATGFGLTALCIGDQRGYQDSAQIKSRVLATLNSLVNQTNVHGFYYHFVDMNTGQRVWNCELSSIDTAILLCGVLACRQHFQDPQIQSLAAQIYQRVDWPWMLNGGTTLSMGWTPESGFLSGRWDAYCELMMIYLLAIGSTTHPIPASSWSQFARPTLNYQGYSYITDRKAPLFIHQYSQAWFDFRNQQDAYANYFNNSVTATKAHKAFCLSLAGQFPDYRENLWGVSASDSAKGYVAWGGPPMMGNIDGTIVPCAAGGSLPFLSQECIAVLRNISQKFPKSWQRYGFVDAFNPLTSWYDPDVIGIDVGITMLMAENQRTGFVWNTFMKNPEARDAMEKAGFKAAVAATGRS